MLGVVLIEAVHPVLVGVDVEDDLTLDVVLLGDGHDVHLADVADEVGPGVGLDLAAFCDVALGPGDEALAASGVVGVHVAPLGDAATGPVRHGGCHDSTVALGDVEGFWRVCNFVVQGIAFRWWVGDIDSSAGGMLLQPLA